MKRFALVLLSLAIVAIGISLWCGQKFADVQGPEVLQVDSTNVVWLTMDDSVLRIDASGRLLSKVDIDSLGLRGRISNAALHPSGDLVFSTKGDSTLYFISPDSAKVSKALRLQWPKDLKFHSTRAIHFAISAQGLIAVANGGGHAVALFDSEGKSLRRTSPGQYRFTNGLWWAGTSLWTTNTNGFELIELDIDTMAPKSKVSLSDYETH